MTASDLAGELESLLILPEEHEASDYWICFLPCFLGGSVPYISLLTPKLGTNTQLLIVPKMLNLMFWLKESCAF